MSVVDLNPVTRLRAHLDGFSTPPRDVAIANADVIITVTGARDVLTAADIPLPRDSVILAIAGHFPAEIDVRRLIGAVEVTGQREYADDLLTLELNDGRCVHLLARGHMFNLAGPGRSATPSSRWTWDSPCRPAAWRRSPTAASTPPAALSRSPGVSTRLSPAATSTTGTRRGVCRIGTVIGAGKLLAVLGLPARISERSRVLPVYRRTSGEPHADQVRRSGTPTG